MRQDVIYYWSKIIYTWYDNMIIFGTELNTNHIKEVYIYISYEKNGNTKFYIVVIIIQ